MILRQLKLRTIALEVRRRSPLSPWGVPSSERKQFLHSGFWQALVTPLLWVLVSSSGEEVGWSER